jgi:integrase
VWFYWCCWDWRRGKGGGWYFDKVKTPESRREVVLPGYLVDWLLEHRQNQKTAQPQFQYLDLVFRAEPGGPLHSDNLGARDLRRILKAAGLPYTGEDENKKGFRLYDLRHSCATLLLTAGKHAKVVADRLGHASVATTMDVYAHVTRRLEQDVEQPFDDMLAGVGASRLRCSELSARSENPPANLQAQP